MAASYDKTVLVGNLGSDPQVHQTQNGKAICTVSVAVNRYRTKDDEREQVTTWVPVVLRGQLAEFAGQYTGKGTPVLVEGFHQENRWQDKDGNDHHRLEVVATDFQSLAPKPAE